MKISLIIAVHLISVITTQTLINNPIQITNTPYPEVTSKNNQYTIDTKGATCYQTITTAEVSCLNTCIYDPPSAIYLLGNDKYIYKPDGYYLTTIDSDSCGTFKQNSYTDSSEYVGVIEETVYSGTNTFHSGYCCEVKENERIVYGKVSNKKLKFTFIVKGSSETIELCNNLEDIISCKKYDSSQYICAYICDGVVYIGLVVYKTHTSWNRDACSLYLEDKKEIVTLRYHTNIIFYEISQNSKMVCAINKSSKNLECSKLNVKVNTETDWIGKLYYTLTLTFSASLSYSLQQNSNGDKGCAFTKFNSERLICCGENEKIKCYRADSNDRVLSSFEIPNNGVNSYVSIMESSKFVTIFYMNTFNNNYIIYSYYIYIPECDSSKTLSTTIYHSVNEKNAAQDMKNFLTKRTNTNYYLTFDELPTSYGDFKLNDNIVTSTNDKILIEDDKNYTIDFISTNSKSVTNFKIKYTIYIEETYSTQCYISLNIKSCYISCIQCSADVDSSTSDDHHCLPNSCSTDYYVDPTKDTNCYKISEKKINWYFDNDQQKFFLCNTTCESCETKADENSTHCITCNDKNLYLLNGNCLIDCPDGYVKTTDSNNVKRCEKCYDNCKTCTAVAQKNNLNEIVNMNCIKCITEQDPNNSTKQNEITIKVNDNCFKINVYNEQKITFDSSMCSNTQDNCLGYGLSIIYGEYECKTKPENTYYVLDSSDNTGVIKYCDIACKTCNAGLDDIIMDTNCIICSDGYFKTEDSNTNCILESLIPDNYYKDIDNIYYHCFYTCAKCNGKYDSASNDMQCISCINNYYLEENTNNCYNSTHADDGYVLINNTWKKCYNSCETCSALETTTSHNCINCTTNKYKIEGTDNCFNEDELKNKSYFLDNVDLVWKSCFSNCLSCNNFGTLNDQKCETCINNYYLEENTKNCYNISYTEQGYYLDKDNLFKKCYFSCEKCISGYDLTTNNMTCTNCINDYFFENATNNCYNSTHADDGYLLENNIWYKCYKNCAKCTALGTENDQYCIICIKGAYKIEGTDNCFTQNEMIGKNYYLDGSSLVYKKCYDFCSTCVQSGTDSNNNCDTCINDYYLKLNTKNCYNITYKEQGYYLDNNNYFRECFKKCKTCSNSGSNANMNCEKCIDNYYFENSTTNCYDMSYILNPYYFDNNTKKFYKCFDKCLLCSTSGYEDIQNDIYDHNCDKCISNYYFEENTKNCYNNSYVDKGYYLDTFTINPGESPEFKKCYINCKTCTNYYINNNMNCLLCADGYYKMEESKTNCILESLIPENYYKNSTDDVYYRCYDLCRKCVSKYDSVSNNMNCISCVNNYYLEDGSKNCYNSTHVDDNFVLINNIWYKCYSSCDYCSERGTKNNQNCINCVINKYKVYGTNNCFSEEEMRNEPYYFDKNISNWKNCYTTCATCTEGGTSTNHNCDTCKVNYYFLENTKNCYDVTYKQKGYYIDTDNYFKKCFDKCKVCTAKGSEDNMNCEKCIDNYYFEDSTTNCYNMSYILNPYYFDNNTKKFYKCFDKCLLCSTSGYEDIQNDIYDHNCDKCISNYYFEENTKNCYNNSYADKGYYLDTFTINPGESPEFKKCYINCKTCTNYYINDNMNCILCKDNYYKINGTDNCFSMDLINNGFYFTNNTFYPCSDNCLTCSDSPSILNSGITTNNCLSCDKTNKDLYLVDQLNNCEPKSYANNSYYLKPNNQGIEIFYKCYQSCKLCDNGYEIDSNTQIESFHCNTCIENYYKLKYTDNCYGNEMLNKGYHVVRNYWTFCHENCEECSQKPTTNNLNEVTSQNCISCYNDLKFIYQTSDCGNDTLLENGYYFSTSDQMYHKCHDGCKKCNPLLLNGHNCITCDEQNSYYNAEDKSQTNCYNSQTIGSGYFLNEIDNKTLWSRCYSLCDTCFYKGNDTEHLCKKCISHYYIIHDTNNCLKDSEAEDKGYYFDTKYSEFVKCDQACLTCYNGLENGNTNCLKCNNDKEYYYIENDISNCYNNETIPEGYFLNKISQPYKWNKCQEKCATCSKLGSSNNMYCITCKKNLLDEKGEKITYKLFSGNCLENCPDNYLVTIPGDECVTECPYGLVKFPFNKTCLENCPPDNYTLNKKATTCIAQNLDSVDLDPEELKKILIEDIDSYTNQDRVIGGKDYKAQVLDAESIDTKKQLENGVSSIDFGDCLQILKQKYGMDESNKIVILKFDKKTTNEDGVPSSDTVEFNLYDENGVELDLSYCKNVEITIIKPIGDIDGIDIDAAKEMDKEGIDVFNAKDEYFNDICHPSPKGGVDATVSNRREDQFQNVSFCDDGCSYEGVNYDIMGVKCSCSGSILFGGGDETEEEKNNRLKNMANAFISELVSFNFVIVKCTNLIFNKNIFYTNVGFYVIFAYFTIQIIFLIIYIVKGVKHVENCMLVFDPWDPEVDPRNPPKKKNTNNSIFDKIKNEDVNVFNIDDNMMKKINENNYDETKYVKKIKLSNEKEKEDEKEMQIKTNKKEKKIPNNPLASFVKLKTIKLQKMSSEEESNSNSKKENSKEEEKKRKTMKIIKSTKKKSSTKSNVEERDISYISPRKKNSNRESITNSTIFSPKHAAKKSSTVNLNNFVDESDINQNNFSKRISQMSPKKQRNLCLNILKEENSSNFDDEEDVDKNDAIVVHFIEEEDQNSEKNDIDEKIRDIRSKKKLRPKKISGNTFISKIPYKEKMSEIKEDLKENNDENNNDYIRSRKNSFQSPKKKLRKIRTFNEKENNSLDEDNFFASPKKSMNLKQNENENKINSNSDYIGNEDEGDISPKFKDKITLSKVNKKKHNDRNRVTVFSKKSDNNILETNEQLKTVDSIVREWKKKSKYFRRANFKAVVQKSPVKKEKKKEEPLPKLVSKKVALAFTSEELFGMEFDEAVKNDERKCIYFYSGYLLEDHNVINTFCDDDFLELRYIKLSVLVYTYTIDFFTNALFYTDDYVSDTYNNDGVVDYVSSLPKSIYAFLIGFVSGILLGFLTSNKDELKEIALEETDKKQFHIKLEKGLKKLKWKINIYFIVVFVSMIFFWYYVIVFCGAYPNSQLSLFYGCLESSAMDFATPFLICAVLAVARFIALKKRVKWLYDLVSFVDKFI